MGDKWGVPQPAWAPAAIANNHTIKLGCGDGEGMPEPLKTPCGRAGAGQRGVPGWVAGSCSILQQMPCKSAAA